MKNDIMIMLLKHEVDVITKTMQVLLHTVLIIYF